MISAFVFPSAVRRATNPRQAAIFKALAMPEPPRFLHLEAAPADA
jgi:hypothetical protein